MKPAHRLMLQTKQKPFIQQSCHINQPFAAVKGAGLKIPEGGEEVGAIKEPLAVPPRKSH